MSTTNKPRIFNEIPRLMTSPENPWCQSVYFNLTRCQKVRVDKYPGSSHQKIAVIQAEVSRGNTLFEELETAETQHTYDASGFIYDPRDDTGDSTLDTGVYNKTPLKLVPEKILRKFHTPDGTGKKLTIGRGATVPEILFFCYTVFKQEAVKDTPVDMYLLAFEDTVYVSQTKFIPVVHVKHSGDSQESPEFNLDFVEEENNDPREKIQFLLPIIFGPGSLQRQNL